MRESRYHPANMSKCLSVVFILAAALSCRATQARLWLSDFDKSIYFQQQTAPLPFQDSTNDNPTITVNDTRKYQSIDGFGACLTGGSALHLLQMDNAKRAALLNELFGDKERSIGISYLRVSIGASDLNDAPYSYDDLTPGQTDASLSKFSFGPDTAAVIPVLQEILAINPAIKILGSPWSAPPWMKDNHDTRGGHLQPQYYAAYARYFVKYIEGMKAQGIPIDAITVQNEPLNAGNNPSMVMTAIEQDNFVKNNLGPAFRAAGLTTKIIVFDHNCDHPDYPLTILNDPEARQYVDGSAFHLYAGRISALSKVHDLYPDKSLYFTEQWMGGHSNQKQDLDEHIRNVVIGSTRNWSRNALEWNLAADSQFEPHTDRGGCPVCQGSITIDGNTVTRNAGYYVLAHAAKFIRPGSVRIESNYLHELPNAAFKNPTGQTVLLVVNNSPSPQTFNIRCNGHQATASLNSGAVGTFVW